MRSAALLPLEWRKVTDPDGWALVTPTGVMIGSLLLVEHDEWKPWHVNLRGPEQIDTCASAADGVAALSKMLGVTLLLPPGARKDRPAGGVP